MKTSNNEVLTLSSIRQLIAEAIIENNLNILSEGTGCNPVKCSRMLGDAIGLSEAEEKIARHVVLAIRRFSAFSYQKFFNAIEANPAFMGKDEFIDKQKDLEATARNEWRFVKSYPSDIKSLIDSKEFTPEEALEDINWVYDEPPYNEKGTKHPFKSLDAAFEYLDALPDYWAGEIRTHVSLQESANRQKMALETVKAGCLRRVASFNFTGQDLLLVNFDAIIKECRRIPAQIYDSGPVWKSQNDMSKATRGIIASYGLDLIDIFFLSKKKEAERRKGQIALMNALIGEILTGIGYSFKNALTGIKGEVKEQNEIDILDNKGLPDPIKSEHNIKQHFTEADLDNKIKYVETAMIQPAMSFSDKPLEFSGPVLYAMGELILLTAGWAPFIVGSGVLYLLDNVDGAKDSIPLGY